MAPPRSAGHPLRQLRLRQVRTGGAQRESALLLITDTERTGRIGADGPSPEGGAPSGCRFAAGLDIRRLRS
jgi:hypothetical protein